MLQFIRDSVSTWIVKGLFVLLIASFAVWGIGDIFRTGGNDTVIAEVEDFDITFSDLDQEFRNQIRFIQQNYGQSLEYEQALEIGLLEQSLDVLIQRALYELAIRDLDLMVDDTVIGQLVQKDPTFQGVFGEFDRDTFNRRLAATGMTESTYLTQLRSEVPLELLRSVITQAMTVPSTVAQAAYVYYHEKRTAQTLVFPYTQNQQTLPIPDQETLENYYEENKVRFVVPVLRHASLVLLNTQLFVDSIDIDDQTLLTEFDKRKEDLIEQELRTVRNIVIDTLDQANEIIALAHKKESEEGEEDGLQAAADTLGLEIHKLTKFSKTGLPDIGEVAFSLPKGQISEPIETPFGWHVIEVQEIVDERIPTFEEAKEELLTILKEEQAEVKLYDVTNTFDSELSKGFSIEEVTAKLGLSVIEIAEVDAQGKDRNGNYISHLQPYPEIVSTIFSLPLNDSSLITEIPERQVFFIVQVHEEFPSEERPFEEVKEQIKSEWQQEQHRQSVEQQANQVAIRLEYGANLESIAEEFDLQFDSIGPVSRIEIPETLPATLKQALFTLPQNGAATGETEQGVMVLQVIEVEEPDLETASLDQVRTELNGDIVRENQKNFVDSLRQIYNISTYPERLQSLFYSNSYPNY